MANDKFNIIYADLNRLRIQTEPITPLEIWAVMEKVRTLASEIEDAYALDDGYDDFGKRIEEILGL